MRASSQWLDQIGIDYLLKRLYWHGRVDRQDLMRALNVASAKASNLLSDARQRFPNRFMPAGRGYVPHPDFVPPNVSGDIFLEDLERALGRDLDSASVAGEAPPARITRMQPRGVRTEVLRRLLIAFRERMALDILYVGMERGAVSEWRTVEPVELVFINERWHLRACCYRSISISEDDPSRGWRHFVLSRILDSGALRPARYAWLASGNTQPSKHKAVFVPHPSLTADQRQAVSFEFQMSDDQLNILASEDDLFYFRERHVAKNDHEGPPEKLLVEVYSSISGVA